MPHSEINQTKKLPPLVIHTAAVYVALRNLSNSIYENSNTSQPLLHTHLVIFRAVGHYDPPPPTQGLQRVALSSPNGFHFAICFHIEPLLSFAKLSSIFSPAEAEP